MKYLSSRLGLRRLMRVLAASVITFTTVAACQPAPPDATVTVAGLVPTTLPTAIHATVPASADASAVASATPAIPSTPTVVPSPTPLQARTVWIDPVLPADLHDQLVASVQALAKPPDNAPLTLSTDQKADITIAAAPAPSAGAQPPALVLITRTLAVAAPFPTIADSITVSALTAFWQGDPNALKSLTNDGSAPTLFLDPNTRAAMVLLLGEPSPTASIQLVEARDLVATTWAARPASFAILPFEQLEARWKLIWLDGQNLFDRQMDVSKYPLTLRVVAAARNPQDAAWLAGLQPRTNRDVGKLAIVAMTGVTAMVRGTAVQMERKGITYPGQQIRDWLLSADVRHISNEVSFWDHCPAPTFYDGTSMCSNPKYIDLLKYVGANLIELSGNHLWDKGLPLVSSTLKLYEDLGWSYFAGGRTYTESLRPVTMTVAGNRLAFVGCNWFGSDWATPENGLPGSALCGSADPHALDLITPTIQSLAQQGYLVIATIQYAEFYFYEPTPQQEQDFNALRAAGAVVVNGSQGHHVQGFDVSAQGFIHYGTGNLFFGDQEGDGTHQTCVDRHVFYDGRYLGVDIRTAFIQDYSQPVPMSPAYRAKLLKTLFEATGY